VDTYVLTGTGDPERLLHDMGFFTWDTEEVLDMVRWVRSWNADPSHPRKVRFLGVDLQSRGRLVPFLAERLRQARFWLLYLAGLNGGPEIQLKSCV
jgi:erythromycin esterase